MKSKKEIFDCYYNDNLEALNSDELEVLESYLRRKTIKQDFPSDTMLENQYKEHPERRPQPKIQSSGRSTKNIGDVGAFYFNYLQRHDIPEVNDTTMDLYFNDSDTGCEDNVSAWSPADTYAKTIWHSFLATSNLFQVAVKGIDVRAGDGLSVQIKVAGAFGDPTEKASCECGSCASISFSTYTLTVKQYNMEAVICEKDIFDVGNDLMDAYVTAMREKWTSWFDEQIYTELETASAGYTENLASSLKCTASISGSCCSDSSFINLYNSIEKLVADMKEGNYKPDYLIISPSVGKILKSLNQEQVPAWAEKEIVFGADGSMQKAAGLKVIEYAGANSCTDASGEVVAIVVDSRRAVGAVFGQKPKMYRFFQSNCNSWRIDWWSFFAVSELDVNAIGQIKNP